MNSQEIETAVRLKLPIIMVVWVDNDLNLISLKKTQFRISALTKIWHDDFPSYSEEVKNNKL